MFQSAPLTKARGDINEEGTIYNFAGFNPLPSQKQGETPNTGPRSVSCFVSIRSPHKSKGRPCAARGISEPEGCFNPLPSQKQGETSKGEWQKRANIVSIRSPHKSKGRPSLS